MPGLAQPRGENPDLYAVDEPDDSGELVTEVLRVEAACFEEIPPTTVGNFEGQRSRRSEPLIFYVEDKTQRRLRLAAALLLGVLVALLIFGNWLYSWEPNAVPAAQESGRSVSDGLPAPVTPLPADGSQEP